MSARERVLRAGEEDTQRLMATCRLSAAARSGSLPERAKDLSVRMAASAAAAFVSSMFLFSMSRNFARRTNGRQLLIALFFVSRKKDGMNHLTHSLQSLISLRGMNPLEASKEIATSPSTLSRILSESVLPSHETLRAVMMNLAKNDKERREIALAWAMDEMERIGAAGLVGFSEVHSTEDPEISRLKMALLNQSQSIDAIADLAADIVVTCTRITNKARDSVGNPPAEEPKRKARKSS